MSFSVIINLLFCQHKIRLYILLYSILLRKCFIKENGHIIMGRERNLKCGVIPVSFEETLKHVWGTRRIVADGYIVIFIYFV